MKSIAFQISDDESGSSDDDDIFTPKILRKQAKVEKDLHFSAQSTVSSKKRRTVYEIERDAKVAKLLQKQQQKKQMQQLQKTNTDCTAAPQQSKADINIKTMRDSNFTNSIRSNNSKSQVQQMHSNTTYVSNKQKPQLTSEQQRQRTYRKNLCVMRNALKQVDPQSKQLAQLKTANITPTSNNNNINNIKSGNTQNIFNNDSYNRREYSSRGGNNNSGNTNSYYKLNKQGVQMYSSSGSNRGGYHGRGNRYNNHNSGNNCNNQSNDNAHKRRRFD